MVFVSRGRARTDSQCLHFFGADGIGKEGNLATGTVQGAICNHTDRGGVPCVDGLCSMGGLAFDSGEHTGSQRLQEVPHDTWRAHMDR